MSKKIYFPGEEIAIEEEYSAGKKAFEENGAIKASVYGELILDDMNREADIKGKMLEAVDIGDIVYGKVTTVKESSAVVELIKAENNKVLCNTRAQLPVRNVSKEYVTNLGEFYHVGDFIKARISNVDKYSIDIATNETGLGVMNAYCSKCKSNLNYSNEKMMCLNCGNVETRKWFEKEDVRKERPAGDRPSFSRGGSRGFDRNNKFPRNNNRGSFGNNRNNNKFSGRNNFRGGRR